MLWYDSCYHAVQALDPDFQRLLLLNKLLQLHLSRHQGLVILGLHHFNVLELKEMEGIYFFIIRNLE